ncbi:MAG: thioredoxin [Actinomycetota bacterium]
MLTDQNFEAEVIDSDLPVLVDFWAEWCHPCHLVAPEVEALAREEPHRLKVGKLDIDDNPIITGRYGVLSIPTLLLFVNGSETARIVGVRRKQAILAEIERHLQPASR